MATLQQTTITRLNPSARNVRQDGRCQPGGYHDTNHSNSGKKFKEQIRIAKEVMHNRQLSSDIKSLVKGLMIESYIEEGSQKIGEHVYGKSITDPCLGWEDSKKLIYDIAEMNS